MKKIKIFKNYETHCMTQTGARYIEATWARDEVENFINRKDIKVLSIHYAGGNEDSTMVIYEEIC